MKAGLKERVKDMTKHMFAGANTPIGFVDFFDNIMPLEKAKKRYYLKGSSGSGKSTFIKKISEEFEALKIDMEKFHCANDIDSLDALSVGSKGLCILDATQPHSRDPEIPIAIDRIIDFAKFIDKQKIDPYVDEIKSLLKAKKHLNEKVSAYLAAVGSIYLADNGAYKAALKKHYLNELLQKWLKLLDIEKTHSFSGIDRKLFISAITPDGFISFAKNHFEGCKVYGLCGASGFVAHIFLSQLRDKANACGMNTESFYRPFAPEQLEYLHLPEINTAFAILDDHFGYDGDVKEKIDMSNCVKLKTSEGGDCTLFHKTLKTIINLMYSSRTYHIKVEEIYSNAIDFEEVQRFTEKAIYELL